jgi:hypothetical protein
MAQNAKGQLRFLVEEAGEFGLTVGPLHQVEFTKLKGTIKIIHLQRWLADASRPGFYDGTWKLAPFMSGDGSVDFFDFLFTSEVTAMEFKIMFG